MGLLILPFLGVLIGAVIGVIVGAVIGYRLPAAGDPRRTAEPTPPAILKVPRAPRAGST